LKNLIDYSLILSSEEVHRGIGYIYIGRLERILISSFYKFSSLLSPEQTTLLFENLPPFLKVIYAKGLTSGKNLSRKTRKDQQYGLQQMQDKISLYDLHATSIDSSVLKIIFPILGRYIQRQVIVKVIDLFPVSIKQFLFTEAMNEVKKEISRNFEKALLHMESVNAKQKNEFIRRLQRELSYSKHPDRARMALRNTFNIIKNHSTFQEALTLMTQFPAHINEIFAENWKPTTDDSDATSSESSKDLHQLLQADQKGVLVLELQNVFRTLSFLLSEDQKKNILWLLPKPMQTIWMKSVID
jgi:uncharacterized protein (DUF2267 family)